tara:strand:- start:2282 stop:2761 length:480 start_codon:yes stop_codon:yes gene_type:complete
MKQTIYTIYDPKIYESKTTLFNHYIYKNKKSTIIAPIRFQKNSINPVNFLQLKIKYNIKNILILDRTKPSFKKASIVGHVNRSGFNFFIGSKRIQGLPMFPDMSNIYQPIKGLEKINVHTVGLQRFKKEPLEKQITSEYIGLVSPLWHYAGVCVFGKTV